MRYINVGKIVNTHGIKGELRVLSDFKYKSRIFKKDFNIYIGENKIEETIVTYRYHKIFDMITLKNYNNINDVLKYKGKLIYIDYNDLILNNSEYLNEDLINMNVIMNGKLIGIVKKIEKNNTQELIIVKNDKKEYLIPYVSDIIETINLNERKIILKYIKGLIE